MSVRDHPTCVSFTHALANVEPTNAVAPHEKAGTPLARNAAAHVHDFLISEKKPPMRVHGPRDFEPYTTTSDRIFN
jgi:hypothetical protein